MAQGVTHTRVGWCCALRTQEYRLVCMLKMGCIFVLGGLTVPCQSLCGKVVCVCVCVCVCVLEAVFLKTFPSVVLFQIHPNSSDFVHFYQAALTVDLSGFKMAPGELKS